MAAPEKTKTMDTSKRIDGHARVNRRLGVGANGDEAGRWSDWRWRFRGRIGENNKGLRFGEIFSKFLIFIYYFFNKNILFYVFFYDIK